MSLGSTISRSHLGASSSSHKPSRRSGSASTKSTVQPAQRPASSIYKSSLRNGSASTIRLPSSESTDHLRPSSTRASTSASISITASSPSVASRIPKAAPGRASTVTSATSMSNFIQSASSSRESMSASISSTLRAPTLATRTSEASTMRNSTFTSTTSTSNLAWSASTASTVGPHTSTSAASSTNITRSIPNRAPSRLTTTASRLLWGRRPPGHSTLMPSQIAALTHTLSLPADTPMLSSVVGALGVPLSRSQFSSVRTDYCDAHFWFEQEFIDELTEVIAHEIGPQLDKLRVAPKQLISKKTERLLSILQPYQDISISFNDTRSNDSTNPTCAACTLSRFFQNPKAVKALATCVKGRKHKSHPWPVSMAWLDPCPPKGADWEGKWKTDGKLIAHDRARVQRWRRSNRVHETAHKEPPVLGHQAGEGCDFCDALRGEQAGSETAIAEEEEEEEEEEEVTEEPLYEAAEGTNNDGSEPVQDSDSATVRATREQSIIGAYMNPPTDQRHSEEAGSRKQSASDMKEDETAATRASAKRASEWAESYRRLVGRGPVAQTTVQIRGMS